MSANIELVRAFYTAMAKGDIGGATALTAPGLTISQSRALPWGGEERGVGGLAAFFGRIRARIDSRVHVEHYIDAIDDVVAIGRTSGTVRASGAAFDIAVAHVFTIRDGRIAGVRVLLDTPPMLEVLAAER